MVTAPVEVRRFQPFSALETDLSTTLSLSGVAPCSNFLVVFFNTGVTHGYPWLPNSSHREFPGAKISCNHCHIRQCFMRAAFVPCTFHWNVCFCFFDMDVTT